MDNRPDRKGNAMTDLSALRKLVEAVLSREPRIPRLAHGIECGCASEAHGEGWDEERTLEVAAWETSLGPMATAAREALERVELERHFLIEAFKEKTSDFMGEMVRHQETARRLTTRLAQLEAALAKYGRHDIGCPEDLTGVVDLKSEFRQRPCSCGFAAALEGRDE